MKKTKTERHIERMANVEEEPNERLKKIIAWIREHVRIGWKKIWLTFKW